MVVKLFVGWCCLVSMLFSVNSVAQIAIDGYQWRLKKDNTDIQIYTSKVEGSKYLAVSASMQIKATVDSAAALIMDLKNCQQLSKICREAYIHERLSDTQSYVYSRNDIPFPGRDRDVVSHVVWSNDTENGVLMMISQAVTGVVPKVKGVIRIEQATVMWRFTPKDKGMILVESFAHVNPASPMPKWLLNRLLINSPYKTMKNIRKLIGHDEGKTLSID